MIHKVIYMSVDQYSLEYYLETLKSVFDDNCSFEYDETDRKITMKCSFMNSGSYLALWLNEYNMISEMYYSEYDLYDEIVFPESLHDSPYEEYTEEELEKLEKESEKEIDEWDEVELIKFDIVPQREITIMRTVESVIDYVDFAHYHYFKGHSIYAKNVDINEVINIVKSFDMLIAIAEKYYELRKRLEQLEKQKVAA